MIAATTTEVAQLVMDLARETPHSHAWLANQINYLRTCGLWSTFDEMAAFARRCIDHQIPPSYAADIAIEFGCQDLDQTPAKETT